jgi:hypothetical protein
LENARELFRTAVSLFIFNEKQTVQNGPKISILFWVLTSKVWLRPLLSI